MSASARRTLVKSPPELWAELSDADALARHLEPFGEIRITRLEPETTVAWEGERAHGTVQIEPSGWGTKVTLTAEPSRPEPTAGSRAPATDVAVDPHAGEAPAEQGEELVDPEPELPQTLAALGQAGEVSLSPARTPGPASGPSRWSRLRPWGRSQRHAPPPSAHPDPEPGTISAWAPECSAPAPSPTDAVAPEPTRDAADDPKLDAVLSGVLDDLGSAHHRPFSRG